MLHLSAQVGCGCHPFFFPNILIFLLGDKEKEKQEINWSSGIANFLAETAIKNLMHILFETKDFAILLSSAS